MTSDKVRDPVDVAAECTHQIEDECNDRRGMHWIKEWEDPDVYRELIETCVGRLTPIIQADRAAAEAGHARAVENNLSQQQCDECERRWRMLTQANEEIAGARQVLLHRILKTASKHKAKDVAELAVAVAEEIERLRAIAEGTSK